MASNVCREYPSALIDLHYVNHLDDRFDEQVLQLRVEILFNEVVKAGYNEFNITDYPINDAAKSMKISYFLKNINSKGQIKILEAGKIKLPPLGRTTLFGIGFPTPPSGVGLMDTPL